MLFVGDDWAEDHHDVEIVDDAGRLLARRRLPEGVVGGTRLHAVVAEQMPHEWAGLEPAEAAGPGKVGIETDRRAGGGGGGAGGPRLLGGQPPSGARSRGGG